MRGADLTRRALFAAAGFYPILVLAQSARAQQPTESELGLASVLSDGGFTFDRLAWVAQEVSAGRIKTPQSTAPQFAKQLTYDGYRRIAFRPDHALWREDDVGFQVQLAHPGWLYSEPVTVLEETGGTVAPVSFDPSMFNYYDESTEAAAHSETGVMGFSGVRLLSQLNYPGKWDEVVVFQGASYFRALGRNSRYGLSARGLAIDTAAPNGEEFPRFSVFVLERPNHPTMLANIYALLESPSVCGAYRFSVVPGDTTTIDVEARLFPRKKIGVLGVAPLTSMYTFGENDRTGVDDFRPEVHDSDGLLVRTGRGELIWRPIINPDTLQVSSYMDNDPRGFGLLQRDRKFTSYEDAEARYERRPSCWVEPLDSWGPGAVRLVEIPTPHEYNDNIVAFWAPEGGLASDTTPTYRYRLHWGDLVPRAIDTAAVVATRVGVFDPEHREATPTDRRFVIDFEGGLLGNLPEDSPVEAVASARDAEIVKTQALPLPQEGGRWRAVIHARRAAAKPADLRCFLRLGDVALTETWSYLWT